MHAKNDHIKIYLALIGMHNVAFYCHFIADWETGYNTYDYVLFIVHI